MSKLLFVCFCSCISLIVKADSDLERGFDVLTHIESGGTYLAEIEGQINLIKFNYEKKKAELDLEITLNRNNKLKELYKKFLNENKKTIESVIENRSLLEHKVLSYKKAKDDILTIVKRLMLFQNDVIQYNNNQEVISSLVDISLSILDKENAMNKNIIDSLNALKSSDLEVDLNKLLKVSKDFYRFIAEYESQLKAYIETLNSQLDFINMESELLQNKINTN